MMSLPKVHGEFRVGTDPEIRFSQGGVAFTSFRAVASKQKKDESGQWVPDKEIWVRVVCFKKTAENVAESVAKGSLVTIMGEISASEYEKDGVTRTSIDITADFVGLSLARDSYAGSTATPSRPVASAGSDAPADNPWGAPAAADTAPPF